VSSRWVRWKTSAQHSPSVTPESGTVAAGEFPQSDGGGPFTPHVMPDLVLARGHVCAVAKAFIRDVRRRRGVRPQL
jgi:hypothetical protein